MKRYSELNESWSLQSLKTYLVDIIYSLFSLEMYDISLWDKLNYNRICITAV